MARSKSKAVVKKVEESKEVEILSAEEVQKIDEAVNFINQQANAPARSLLEIGKYLLETFFDNDPKKVQDRAPRKGVSLRKLAEHPDIYMSYRNLSNAVRLALQEDVFKSVKYKDLTDSHKLLLFSVDGATNKEKLKIADKVIAENLSVRGLHEMLVKKNLLASRGRPSLSEGTPDRNEAFDPLKSFFRPIEKLARLDLDDDFNIEELSDSQFDALRRLRDKLDYLISQRTED